MKINNFNSSINISPQNGKKNFGAYINPDTLRTFRQELSEYDNLEYIKKVFPLQKMQVNLNYFCNYMAKSEK